MASSIEFLIQSIKGFLSYEANFSIVDVDFSLEHGRWYFGHDVQVITFSNSITGWNAIVIPAHSTRASALEGCANNDIHLSSGWSPSLYNAVYRVQSQLHTRIGEICRMDEGRKTLYIDEPNAPCNCQHDQSSPVIVKEDKVRELEDRLQGLEKRLLDIAAPFGDGNVPRGAGSSVTQAHSVQGISSVLQKIESKLEAIEQRMQHSVADMTHTTRTNSGSIHGVTTVADIQDDQPIPSAHSHEQSIPDLQLGAQHQRSEHQPELPRPDAALESPSGSSTLSSQGDIDIEDLHSATDMTPSASITERSVTPRAGPDEAAEINRDIMREEINQALAGAMFSLAQGILGRQGVDERI